MTQFCCFSGCFALFFLVPDVRNLVVILSTVSSFFCCYSRHNRFFSPGFSPPRGGCYSKHNTSFFAVVIHDTLPPAFLFLNSSLYRFFFVGCYAEHSLFPFWLLSIAHFIRILLVVIARTLEFPEQLYCYLLHNAIVNLGLLLLLFAAHHTL